MFDFSYVTTEGTVKKINQDALLIKIAEYKNKQILFMAVADGIGGLPKGETASAFVISEVARWFEKEYSAMLKEGKNILAVRKSLDVFLHGLSDELNDLAEPMGTTYTSVIIDPILDSVLVAHVGDTRFYKIFSDRAEIVTSDHSVVAEEVRSGKLTEEEARLDKRQNQITNCMGAGETGRVYDYIIQKPDKECIYMLCTDGFRKMITKDEILECLSPDVNINSDIIHENLDYLLELNMNRKERDNITAVAVKYKGD
ncbi:MAG: protein phosphatase 2C domain-containing protein [Ruminococcus sp.]|nr:protein phosphatase 2C domain-containing protein [Ruminococcus sp.]MDE7099483.1 protein phosphatase 2C domain-containing protein [Ruminococcus sp.]